MSNFNQAELSIMNDFSIKIENKLLELSAPIQAINPVLNILHMQCREFKLLGSNILSLRIVSVLKSEQSTSINYEAVTDKKIFSNNELGFYLSSLVQNKSIIH